MDRNLTTASNLAIHENILPRANKTKAQRNFGKKANHRYSTEDCWKLYHAVRDANDTLADMIMPGMYTGCRIGELAHMKLDEVGDDWLRVANSEAESGRRHIPIHKDIQQLVERLKQTSKDGYLISGLLDDNQFKNRGKGISQKFNPHKMALCFEKKKHSFHSFRSTMCQMMQDAGLEELFCAHIVGHETGNSQSYGTYARDLNWDVAEAAIAKVNYG